MHRGSTLQIYISLHAVFIVRREKLASLLSFVFLFIEATVVLHKDLSFTHVKDHESFSALPLLIWPSRLSYNQPKPAWPAKGPRLNCDRSPKSGSLPSCEARSLRLFRTFLRAVPAYSSPLAFAPRRLRLAGTPQRSCGDSTAASRQSAPCVIR